MGENIVTVELWELRIHISGVKIDEYSYLELYHICPERLAALLLRKTLKKLFEITISLLKSPSGCKTLPQSF